MQHSNDANDAWFTGSDTTGMPGREQWSAGLRLHMEKQCAMWANITASIEHNVDALGTANMKLYSPEERAALAIMMGNMEQLLGQVEDEPGPLIKAVLARLDTALRAYDLFIARSDSCPPA